MSDIHWLEITTICGHIGAFTSTVANLILLSLLTIFPSKALGSYKYLMITFCVFSLFYTSVETFLRPLIHIYDNTIFVIQRKRFDYSQTTARAVSCPMMEKTKESLMHVITESYNLDPFWVGNVPYSYFRYENGIESLNPRNIFGIFQHCIIMTLSFGTVLYCGFLTYKSMKTHKGMSDKTRELQKQLFQALVMQTIIPMCFMYLPTTMLFVTPFLGLNIGCYGNITIVTVHLYPGIDPVLCLFIIRDFRRALLKCRYLSSNRRKSGTVTSTLSQHQIGTAGKV